MAILATILYLFKGKQMKTYRETKKSHYAKLQAKQFRQTRKKYKTTKQVNLLEFDSKEGHFASIFIGETSICSESQLSPEQFDNMAHDAMLDMLTMDSDYYYQFRTYNEPA